MFIRRDENQTELIDDFDKLTEQYANCFYRNENSAIDLCDGNVVRILGFSHSKHTIKMFIFENKNRYFSYSEEFYTIIHEI